MYKTGQLLKLTRELSSDDPEIMKKVVFGLKVNDSYKKLSEGPVEIITECYVWRDGNGSE
ncbi:hypothetical protein D3C76_1403750 [compost metagenome]